MLATLEYAGIPKNAVTLNFLLPADAQAGADQRQPRRLVDLGALHLRARLSGEARIVRDGQGITPGFGFQVAHADPIRVERPLLEDFVRRLAKARVWATAKGPPFTPTPGPS